MASGGLCLLKYQKEQQWKPPVRDFNLLLPSFLPGQLPRGVGGGAGRVWPERGSKAGVGGRGVARQTQTTVTKV